MTVTYHAGRRIQGLDADRTATQLPAGSVGGWVELGRSTSSTPIVSSIPNKRYYMVLSYSNPSAGGNNHGYRFNSDSGNNYAWRYNVNGGSDGVAAPIHYTLNHTDTVTAIDGFNVTYIANYATKEKLYINHSNYNDATGAGTAPYRNETVGKWVNTSNPINQIGYFVNTGNWGAGGEIVVLGWDPADTHTTNFWQELASVELTSASNEISSGAFTAKKYLWIQAYVKGNNSTSPNFRVQVGSGSFDTGANYAERTSSNGGADGTGGSQDHFPATTGGQNGNFINMFAINNANNEKLFIVHGTSVTTTGAGTASTRREIVGKWANTSNQIDRIKIYRTVGDQYQAGSKIKVWGAD